MLRRAVIAALPLLAATPAMASGAKKATAPQDVGQYVDLSSVALPVVVAGQLVNYIFVSVRVVLTSSANAAKMRAKEPYFRDALVRAGHRTPFTDPNDYLVINVPALQGALMRDAGAIAGSGNVKAIVVTSQTPKRRLGVPKPRNRAGGGDIQP